MIKSDIGKQHTWNKIKLILIKFLTMYYVRQWQICLIVHKWKHNGAKTIICIINKQISRKFHTIILPCKNINLIFYFWSLLSFSKQKNDLGRLLTSLLKNPLAFRRINSFWTNTLKALLSHHLKRYNSNITNHKM